MSGRNISTKKERNIAVIGAGFSGLAIAWEFVQTKQYNVTVFKGKEPCASSMASGLMHPYPGERCARSLWATEGMAHTHALLRVAEEALGKPVYRAGILRKVQNDVQRKCLFEHAKLFCDIEQVAQNVFWLPTSITVFAARYLEGLEKAIVAHGATIEERSIEALAELESFDGIILAVGAGIRAFPECVTLPLHFVKGQILQCTQKEELQYSRIGKGYVAITEDANRYVVGSTYEHIFSYDADVERTAALLWPKVSSFFPEGVTIANCLAGMRVTRVGHYAPIVAQINAKTWAITAMGSRGLLYHALLARNFVYNYS